MIHKLKILPGYFKAVCEGVKTFEIRKNDRGFKVGDKLILMEYNDGEYVGPVIEKKITYITDYEQKDGYVVMGIK